MVVTASRLLREFAVFGCYLVVAIVLTWPLATNLTTAVSDLGDPLLNAWILDWDCYALTHKPLHLFDAPIFYPSKFPLAYSEHLFGIAILCLPFYAAGLAPLTIYNLALLVGFALSAYGGYVLARVITGRFMPSIIAGILYGFVPYRFAQLPHVQVVSAAWLPLLLAALLVYRRSPNTRHALLLGGAFLMNGLTNIYFLLFGSVAVVLTLALIAIAESHDKCFWLGIAAALAAASILLLPFLIPYRIVSATYGMKRGEGEALGGSATWNDWLMAPEQSVAYGRIPDEGQRHSERQLFPGGLMLFLTGAAIFLTPRRNRPAISMPARRLLWLDATIIALAVLTYIGAVTPGILITWHGHLLLEFSRSNFPATMLIICVIARLAIRLPGVLGEGNLRTAISRSRFSLELWAAALWIVIGVIGSLGVHAFFHMFLFQRLSPFRAIRAPARWAMIAYAGLAGWAAEGASRFRGRRWVAPLLFVIALADVWPRIRWEHALVEPVPVDRWLAESKAGPLIELPINRLNALFLYLLRATAHHVPLINGISGFEPPLHRALRERPLDDTTLDLLEGNGCRFILVRPEWCGRDFPQVSAWLRRGMEQGRIVFLRRFDGGITGDWLFALPRVSREWQRFRAPQSGDLARLLNGQTTYSGSTFGQLYQPKQGAEISGPMLVSGWALSPHGIRSVNVLVDNGRLRVATGLFAREDVTRTYPWYPQTPRPAFATSLPRRPAGVPVETDVQIEIIDGTGKRTLLPDVLVTWR